MVDGDELLWTPPWNPNFRLWGSGLNLRWGLTLLQGLRSSSFLKNLLLSVRAPDAGFSREQRC